MTLGSGAKKVYLGSEDVSRHRSKTLSPIFTNSTSLFPESYHVKSTNLKKFLDLGIWSVGSRFAPLGPKILSSHK